MQYFQDEIIFRCLREDEDPEKGIFSKNPEANVPIEVFVHNGTEENYNKENKTTKDTKEDKSYRTQYSAWTKSLHVINDHLQEDGKFVLTKLSYLKNDIPEEKFFTLDEVKKSMQARKSKGLHEWSKKAKDICERYFNSSRELDIELKGTDYIRPETLIVVTQKEFKRYKEEFCYSTKWHIEDRVKGIDRNDFVKDIHDEDILKMIDSIILNKVYNEDFDRNDDEKWEEREKDIAKLRTWSWKNVSEDLGYVDNLTRIEKLDEHFSKLLEESIKNKDAEDYEGIVKREMGDISESYFRVRDSYFSISKEKERNW